MARLHDGSDEDLPDLSTVIAHYAKTDSWRSFVNTTISADRQGTAQEIEPETGEDGRKQCSNQVVVAHRPRTSDEKTVRDDSHEKRRVRRQRPLGVVRLNTVLLPQASTFPQPTNRVPVSARAIPRRTLELTIDSRDRTLRQSTPLCLLEDDPSDFASASFTREVSDTGRAQRQKRLRKQTERLKADSEEAVDGSTVVLPPSCSIKATAGKASQTTLSSEPIQAANRSISDDSFKMHTVSTSGCEHAFESEPSATLR